MSTLVSALKGRLLSRVAFLGLALSVAGCSDSASRFDNLFTASSGGAQRVDGGEFARRPVLPHADLPRQIPQRLDGPAQSDPNATLFNARNVTHLSNSNNFRQSRQGYNFSQTPAASPNYQRPSAISQSSAPAIAQQSLPPVQTAPEQAGFEAPQTGQRLTLTKAQSINDREVSRPLLARPAQSLSNSRSLESDTQRIAPRVEAPAIQRFNQGTEWTNHYSPIPTESPLPKASSRSSDAPTGYIAPRGVHTSNVDNFPTSSTRRNSLRGAPKVVRSSVSKPRKTSQAVDPIKVSNISQQSGAVDQKAGWSSTGGAYVTVSQGETLYSISRRYGVPVTALSEANGISNASSVRVGQKILVPTYVYSPNPPVSVPDYKPRQAKLQGNASTQKRKSENAVLNTTYKVQKGDTLSSIARKNGVSLSELRKNNGLYSTDVIRIGQKLNIASPSHQVNQNVDIIKTSSTLKVEKAALNSGRVVLPRSRPHLPKRVVAAQVEKNSARVALPDVKPARNKKLSVAAKLPKLDNQNRVAAYTPPKASQPSVKSQKPTPSQQSEFIWPVRGQIVSSFGANTNGTSNDGIDLNVPVGTPVRAAASGEVIYASSGLTDYGKLVLIRHSNGYVSAYAHNSNLMVKRGQRIRKGQVVAHSGKTGSAKTPRLHFEIRKGKTPVDPLKHLPV